MKRQFPGIPILGLTATATNDVIDDVKKMLGIPTAVLFKAPLNQPNLYYEVGFKLILITNKKKASPTFDCVILLHSCVSFTLGDHQFSICVSSVLCQFEF